MNIKIKPVPYRNYCRGAGSLAMPGSIVHVSESVWYQNPRFYFFVFLIAMIWYVGLTKPTDKLIIPEQTIIIKPAREQIIEEVVVKKEETAAKEAPPEIPAEVIEKIETKPKPRQEILEKPQPAKVARKKEAVTVEPGKKILPEKPVENQPVKKHKEINIREPLQKRAPAPLVPKPDPARQPAKNPEQNPAIKPDEIAEKRIAGKQFKSETLQQKKVQPKTEASQRIEPKSIAASNQKFKVLAFNEKSEVPDTMADADMRPRLKVAAAGTVETVTPELADRSAETYAEVDVSARRVDSKGWVTPSDLKVNDDQNFGSHAADPDPVHTNRLSKVAQAPAVAFGSSPLPPAAEVQLTISNAISGESMRIDNLKRKIYSVAQSLSPEKSPYCCTIGNYNCTVTIGKNSLVRIDFTPKGDVPFDVLSKLEREIHYKRMTQCSD